MPATVANTQTIAVVAAIIERDKQVLVSFRDKTKHQGGRWEFPGGKIELGETPYEALNRELNEELGIEIITAVEFESLVHHYHDKTVNLNFWHVTEFLGEPSGVEGQQIQWYPINRLSQLTFPDANYQIIEQLESFA